MVDLNRVLRKANISRTNIEGWWHYKITREFIAEVAMDYDTFQPTAAKQGRGKDPVTKTKDEPSENVLITQHKDNQEQREEAVINTAQEMNKERQSFRSPRRGLRLTDAGGYLRCDLDGNEHRKHCLVECTQFWSEAAGMKRSLLRNKACFACFGPRDKCLARCTRKPPKEMLCQGCVLENAKFIPAVPLCRVLEHRNQADGKVVLGAMQQFLGRFNGQHYAPEKVLDQAVPK